MKISTKGRYGLRALIDLGIHCEKGCVSLSDIAQRQDLSLNYLENIFSNLKRAELVIGTAGAQGGYVLAKSPENITLKEILSALEGDMSVYDTSGEQTELGDFLNRNVWDVIDAKVDNILKNTTLQDLLNGIQHKNASADCSKL